MSKGDCFFAGYFAALATAIVLGILFPNPMPDTAVKEAVKQGHAEYYLDDKNERQWRWKEIK